jgi:competence protein ComEC
MIEAPRPDVLIAADGSAVAVRGPDGRLSVLKSGSDVFAVREWFAADADARLPKDATLSNGFRCDEAGCVGRLRDGLLVAIAKTIAAFEEDCRRAALVVSVGDAPPGCGTLVVDRQVWRRSGAMALRRTGEGFEITAARPAGYERPWTRTVSAAGSEAPPASRPTSSAPRDATPRGDDLEAGD